MRPRRVHGVSMAEAIVALFLLTAAFLVVIQLFHSGLSSTARIRARSQAITLAREKMEEIRSWARDPAGSGFAFDDWTGWVDLSAPHPRHSQYTVRVRSADAVLYTPCSLFEADEVDPRRLSKAARRVEVTVTWANQSLRLTSLVGSPTRRLGNPALLISPTAAGPLAPNASADFSVQALDPVGQPLSDVFFDWYVEALDGNATVVLTSRDGSTARVTNSVIGANGATIVASGRCRVHARAVVGGREYDVASGDILLNP